MKNYDELIVKLGKVIDFDINREYVDAAIAAIKELQAEVVRIGKLNLHHYDGWGEADKRNNALIISQKYTKAERDELRAKLAALEGQEPAAIYQGSGTFHFTGKVPTFFCGQPLYLAAGAVPQGEQQLEKPNEQNTY